MVIADDELKETIERLLLLYVPDSLDRRDVLENLWDLGKYSGGKPIGTKCPKCGEEMFCIKCDDIDVYTETDTTVKINGKSIYVL